MFTKLNEQIKQIVGKKCWRASNIVTGTLSLFFGNALASESLSDNAFFFVGQYDILIWCDWRLETEDCVLCSSSSDDENIMRAVVLLEGETVTSAEISPPVWDLTLRFSRGKMITVFCYAVKEPKTSTNWDFGINEFSFYIANDISKGTRLGVLPKMMIHPSMLPPTNIEDRLSAMNTKVPYDKMLKIAEAIKLKYPEEKNNT